MNNVSKAVEERRYSRLGTLVVFVVVAATCFSLCVATSAYLYRTDRAAQAWGAVTWAPSYAGIVRSDGMGYLAWSYAIETGDLCFAPYIQETVAYQPQAASGFHLATGDGCFVPQYTLGQGAVWSLPIAAFRWLYGQRDSTMPQQWVSKSSGLGIITGSAAVASIGLAALVIAFRRRTGLRIALLAPVAAFVGMYGFHYATFDAQFSHATSFGLFGMLVALAPALRRALLHNQRRTAVALAFAIGVDSALIGLVRLPNLAVVAVFMATLLWRPTIDALRARRGLSPTPATVAAALGTLAVVALAVLAVQPIAWFRATGAWFPQTYVGQGFTIGTSTPKILLNILLDPTWHGAIPWSPIIIVAAVGFIWGYRVFGVQALGAMLAIGTMLLTAATWTFPTGAGGLGLRFLIDVSPFIAIGVASFLVQARRRGPKHARVATLLVIICIAWSASAMLGYWDARFAITGAPAGELLEVVTTPRLP